MHAGAHSATGGLREGLLKALGGKKRENSQNRSALPEDLKIFQVWGVVSAEAPRRERATKIPASRWAGWLWAAGQVVGGQRDPQLLSLAQKLLECVKT